ncbi:hypothetical protein [Geomicrobium sp. JCM 19055]|uniref:hypothetical protein n=1 Tax=Geomicrobium sp. JCM 19055 TaxID=1460649 RepID=UPI00045ED152|nr:hypothetical protein [Geomicrobium sp. JCM 19055]GAJ99811.1 hypothetical protein JCM19055_2854 [Geomicrobium sp. JCM 19055]
MSEHHHLFHPKRKKPYPKKDHGCGSIIINNNLINRYPYGEEETTPEENGTNG